MFRQRVRCTEYMRQLLMFRVLNLFFIKLVYKIVSRKTFECLCRSLRTKLFHINLLESLIKSYIFLLKRKIYLT